MSCKCYSNGSFKGSFISKENISLKMKSQFEIETNKIDDFFLFFFFALHSIHSFKKATAQVEDSLYGRLGVGTEFLARPSGALMELEFIF